ncbi:uncharacterized protein LOC6552562 [Drosophila erecta]|uniref:GG21417 n=1 Tax=Drosophila erecta TaxID=7220 RepID=B3P0N2_DROER|nr:uncharacterized protein LOC6552562 [Drosophila erecta]EDV48858.1 uncharacterized protein Dere_GG21417 [Drosophila erecta]
MMKCTGFLSLLVVLLAWNGRVLAIETAFDIWNKFGDGGALPNDPERLNEKGILVLNPTNELQDKNEGTITQLRNLLDNYVGKLLSDLPNTRKKKRRQALQESLHTLTGLSLSISPLQNTLSNIKNQEEQLVPKLNVQEEWKFWAAAKVSRVQESTRGLRTAEAVSITENLNNRYGLRLRSCVGLFIWNQIRFNLDLESTLNGLQISTGQLIDASEGCSSVKPKTCRRDVRRAIDGIQNAPQNLLNLRNEGNQLEDIQRQSNQCVEKTLREYAEERVEVERQLEDIIADYRESETPRK